MLSRLRMNIDECYYAILSLFDSDWSNRQRSYLGLARFKITLKSKSEAKTMEESLKEMIKLKSKSHNPNEAFLQPNEHACRT